jgi:deoxyadenosine/deoxycytidine kinase
MKISIEGNIASGKSTLSSRLQNTTRIPVFLEPVDTWTLLDKFYSNIPRWGFTFNTEVLISMSQWKNNMYNAIYERSPNSCRHVFTQLMHDDAILCDEELALFDKLFNTFGWDQDVIIYVRTPPEICFERMHKRGRDCELGGVSLEYLKKLDKKHEDMMNYIRQNKPQIRIIEIDGVASADDVFHNVLSILKHDLSIL